MIAARKLSKYLVVLSLAAAACGGGTDTGGPPPPPGTDGGGMVSFAQDVQPIFNSQCTRCHNSTTANGGLDLSAPGSHQHLVNAAVSADCSAAVPNAPPRVTPGDPMGSMLWRKTKPDPSRCLSPMPFGTAGLGVISSAQFAKIEAWIQQGALNN